MIAKAKPTAETLMLSYVTGGRKSRSITNAIVEMHVVKVRSLATKMVSSFPLCKRDLSEDLEQVGMMGVLDAMQRFDPKRGLKFWTMASKRARGKMLDYLRDIDRVSRYVRIGIKACQLLQAEGVEVTPELVGKRAGITVSLAVDAIRLASVKIQPSDGVFEDAHRDIKGRLGFEDHRQTKRKQNAELRASLIEIMRTCLDDRQRSMMTLYHLDELTMKEVGQLHRVGESRASQIMADAMRRLKKAFPEFSL